MKQKLRVRLAGYEYESTHELLFESGCAECESSCMGGCMGDCAGGCQDRCTGTSMDF